MRYSKRCLTIVGLLLTLVCLHAPTQAAEISDGNELLGYCTATIGAYVNYCYGYLDAVADQMAAHGAVAGFAACIPSTVDDPELRFALITFLRENASAGKLRPTEVVARALSELFPCR